MGAQNTPKKIFCQGRHIDPVEYLKLTGETTSAMNPPETIRYMGRVYRLIK